MNGEYKSTSTLIDNIFSQKLYNSYILPWSISDHLPLAIAEIFPKTVNPKNEKLTISKRVYNNANICSFQQKIKDLSLPPTGPYTNTIFDSISTIFEASFPVKKKTIKKTDTLSLGSL